MAAINDGAADPMTHPKSPNNRPENVSLVPISVGQWPFLFVVTVKDIAAGMYGAFANQGIVLIHKQCKHCTPYRTDLAASKMQNTMHSVASNAAMPTCTFC